MNDADVTTVITSAIDAQREALTDLSLRIHAAPELAYEEHQAAGWCRELLEQHGFETRAVPGVETAFVAERRFGDGRCVGFLGEYDALPSIGHGCGHNLIAGSTIGAGIGLAHVLKQIGGTVRVYGCPAEEGGGGKIKMLERGVFDDVDVAISFHAWSDTGVMVECTGQRSYDFVFHGKASHVATEPWEGASALEAVVLLIGYVNALRQHVRDGVRLHGIITDGGQAANIVPEKASVRLAVRSESREELVRVVARLHECARAAAAAADVRLEVTEVMAYDPLKYDSTLAAVANRRLRELGREVSDWHASASTDVGNVSQLVPTVLLAVQTWPEDTPFHTTEATLASAKGMAMDGMIDGAKAMALVGYDLLTDWESQELETAPSL